MPDREKVIAGLEHCITDEPCCRQKYITCPYTPRKTGDDNCARALAKDVLALLKEQEGRHRLEVHNIGNVDIPEGVSEEHFHLVMNNVVEALKHADKGESYPYEDTGR